MTRLTRTLNLAVAAALVALAAQAPAMAEESKAWPLAPAEHREFLCGTPIGGEYPSAGPRGFDQAMTASLVTGQRAGKSPLQVVQELKKSARCDELINAQIARAAARTVAGN
jgi:hypothetical protein